MSNAIFAIFAAKTEVEKISEIRYNNKMNPYQPDYAKETISFE